ncbi:ParB/RepB/Spo0J family partition protein [Sphingopyxis alaskensis]|uniref:ParB/RepB/Spo0J family partition protein n=1 Tax=Sphingopyxis alaskensis TaxID=117207 RepID=UPI00203E6966|nr:ParB/RepB/Spo0J family partition protein [Sphingopyxis alaskensis]
MARDGQTDPIKVVFHQDQWLLVTGLHRLQGARGLNLPWIDAIEVKGSTAELRRLEASENLHRRDFGPLERAMFVRAIADDAELRWAGKHEGMSPQQIGQLRRWEQERAKAPGVVHPDQAAAMESQHSAAILSGLYGWQEEVAESLGLSARSLRRSLLIHRQLIAPFESELVEALAQTELGQKQAALFDLAAIADDATRRLVIDTIVGDDAGEIRSVADAMVAAGAKARTDKPRLTGDTKWMNGAQGNLARLSASGWKQFAPTLIEMVKPSALPALMEQIEARMLELGDAVLGGDDD